MNMKGILMKQRLRSGEVALAEYWNLPAKGEYLAKPMTTFSFFDFAEGCVERLTLNDEEIAKLKIYDHDDSEILIADIEKVFSPLGDGTLIQVEVKTEVSKKGRMSLDVIREIHVLGTLDISFNSL